MASLIKKTGPFEVKNVRLYTWFTLFFNARFYYPILAILFLDLGLSLEQYVALNAIWAITIFLAEVPSGALADLIGRRKLLIAAGVFMTVEMLVLLFAPKDGGWSLFAICALNRVLSGLSEAAASGADEALAYDSLEERDNPNDWDDVLSATMQWRSAAMLIAVILGAALYDPHFINRSFQALSIDLELTQAETLRIPIFLCFLQALATFFTALRFHERSEDDGEKASFAQLWKQTLQAAKWVFTTKLALYIVTGGLIIDAIGRNFATINSSYYRLIEIPEYLYGVIAAGVSLLGIFVPRVAKALAQKFSPAVTLSIGAIWTLLCLIALIPAWKYYGIIPGIFLMGAIGYIGFLMSRYLHQMTDSSQRATVLSVKGLLFNLGYGAMSLIFSGLVIMEKNQLDTTKATEDLAFKNALFWQPWGFTVIFFLFLFLGRTVAKNSASKDKIS